jgi:hypothetical protein
MLEKKHRYLTLLTPDMMCFQKTANLVCSTAIRIGHVTMVTTLTQLDGLKLDLWLKAARGRFMFFFSVGNQRNPTQIIHLIS